MNESIIPNPAIVAAAGSMAGTMDEGWHTRYLDALKVLLAEATSSRSVSTVLTTAFSSPTGKSFDATGIKSLKREDSSNRLKIEFYTPTRDDPNHTDSVRSHILTTPLGAYQGAWFKRHQAMLGGGNLIPMRVFVNVENPTPAMKVRVLTGVQIYG